MDRLTQLRGGGAGGSRDTSMDGSSPGDSFLTANDSSKYFSLTEDDSFDITKDESLAASSSQNTLSEDLISNLSPIGKDMLDYKIGKQIEAANILSGGVAIFDDNDNSYDGNELVIDDNVETDDKSQSLKSQGSSEHYLRKVGDDHLGESSHIEDMGESKETVGDDNLDERSHIEDIGESKETVDVNLDESSHIEDMGESKETVGDDNLGESSHIEDMGESKETVGDDNSGENSHIEDMRESRETEVMLQIDGNNVDAINIGNGLYLYRKEGQRELEALQIVDDEQQQPTFKFLKVRDNAEGNLEVYEEIEVEVTGEEPVEEGIGHALPQNPEHVPIKDITDPCCSKIVEMNISTPDKEVPMAMTKKVDTEASKDVQAESKTELNLNGKMVKYSESRKSPLMAFHSTPNKEGIPLTKTMVDQQLHPSRHSDNIKKTIEVHTDSCKQRMFDTSIIVNKGTASPEKTPNEAVHEDRPEKKEVPCSKETCNIDKDDVQIVFENKSIEVTDIPYDDEDDEKKIKDSVMEDLKRIGVMSTVSNFSKGPKNKETKLNAVVEFPPKNPGSIKNIKLNDDNSKTQPLALSEIQTKMVEKDPTIEQVIMEQKVTDVKMPERKKSNENEIISIEIVNIEEKELDEDALVIEEVVDEVSQTEVPDLKSQDEIKLVSSAELKTVVMEDQIHIQQKKELTRYIHKKPESSEELKATLVANEEIVKELKEDKEPQNDSQPSGGTIAITKTTKSDNSKLPITKNEFNNPEINKSSKLKTKLPKPSDLTGSLKAFEKSRNKSESCSKIESEVTKTGETQLQNTIETATVEIIKPQINKRTENLSVSQTDNDLTNTKASAPDNLVKIPPKLGNTSHIPDEMEVLPAKDAEAIAASIDLPNKEPSQINVQENIDGDTLNSFEANLNPVIIKTAESKTNINLNSEPAKQSAVDIKPKSINNNHAPVPFGQWTEANRQDYLNKYKVSKVPVNSANTNHLKQPLDLNRRDVLKKIDSQRQTYNANIKIQESLQKGNIKTEAAFASKSMTKRESKMPLKSEPPVGKHKPTLIKKPVSETVQKVQGEPSAAISNTTKEESPRKEINNQHLIDKTIEVIINKPVSVKSPEDVKQTVPDKISEKNDKKLETPVEDQPALLDAIEIKMNELHGIPFVERPPHELPWPYQTDAKVSSNIESQPAQQKLNKIPSLLPLPKSQQKLKDCEDDIIKLEPAKHKSDVLHSVPKSTQKLSTEPVPKSDDESKTSTDKVITEKEFDKFARRNSVTYENCLAVTDAHQVIQTVVPKDMPPKKISRNEQMLAEAKAKSPHKPQPVRQYHPSKGATKYTLIAEAQSKQYQTKLQMAYQTALTTKRQMDSPITIIEDKPVKVMYLDSGVEFTAAQLNVQGRELSPARRAEPDALTVGTNDSLDSDILDAIEDVKNLDETKTKSKHQRKQVLTPVETPDLELIEPGDLGIEVSPKKKRKIDEKPERSIKNLAPKKSYLLGRSSLRPAAASDPQTKVSPREETVQPNPIPPIPPPVHMDTVSAIDNLVKAAEMLENQSECLRANTSIRNVDSPQDTPIKRGRGRPRKYPLPEGSPNAAADKVPSPQKRPRVIYAKANGLSSSDEDTSDDEALIKENWTMGKINENIVCPICSKLFRSENVVFKHVKHCTGPSPSRSDSDKRSPRRGRLSRESERKSRESETTSRDSYTKWNENEPKSRDSQHDDVDYPPPTTHTPRKRKSKDSACKSTSSNDDVIPVETDAKESEKIEEAKKESRKPTNTKLMQKTSNLVCEICGKSFRQLSYLVSHKLQHKKDECKKSVDEAQTTEKSVFSCEKCPKEFRKLHHLVQHRLIHNPVPLRKTSSEQKELPKREEATKAEDQSAGFRCEPCDKSFRKLHHLVEHRETHDGINRQRSNSVTQVNPEKATAPPQCDICGKSFRKLYHLIEHKEQHLETSSEKSDDQKSVKSSLSTKDIIHECNLCYMVFPNEHSLTKHSVICLRKKKQSATKQAPTEDKDGENSAKSTISEESEVKIITEPQIIETVSNDEKNSNSLETLIVTPAKLEVPQQKDKPSNNELVQTADKSDKHLIEPKEFPKSKEAPTLESPISKATNKAADAPAKIKEVDEIIVIEDTPKKKVVMKGKVASVTKRQKVVAPNLVAEERTAAVASSDDDEVRYMFNPDFKIDETAEGKNFMKVRAKKRSSLQIERPNSKDLVRRKSLLQHPPKIPRLRAKSDDTKIASTNQLLKQAVKPKLEKKEPVPSTDSDDSDVKYSFPKNISQKAAQPAKQESVGIDKKRRKTMTEKRKSLSAIAKRKSLGNAIVKPQPPPAKPVKRRTLAAEHRCDCGQLFSSAALLARHASLAHTPPRVRRRRDLAAAGAVAGKQSRSAEKNKLKLGAKKDHNSEAVRKSKTNSDKADARKSVSETVKKTAKSRNRVHGGVPFPEKRARK